MPKRARYRAGDLRARSRIEHGQVGIFGAALGDADRDPRAVGRGGEEVDRILLAAVRHAQRRDIDELADLAVGLADEQVEIVRSGRALLVEDAPAETLNACDHVGAAGEGGDLVSERLAAGDRVQHAARVAALRLHPVDRARILLVFHIAIGIDDRRAEIAVGDRLLWRRRWGRQRRGKRDGGGRGKDDGEGCAGDHADMLLR